MKLMCNGVLYLQESTVRVITAGLTLDEVPEAFKLALEQPCNKAARKSSGGLAFSYRFTDEGAVDWINSQSWILDYGQFEDYLEEDVAEYRDELADENAESIEKFAYMKPAERDAKAEEFYRDIRINDLKAAEATTLLQHKKGEVAFDFPEGYGYTD
jgi:hypothetical protein